MIKRFSPSISIREVSSSSKEALRNCSGIDVFLEIKINYS